MSARSARIVSIVLLIVVAAPAAAQFDREGLPEVVARVDGRPISRSELLGQAELVLAQQGGEVVQDASFYRGVLDQLVNGMLLQQEAARRGVEPSESEVTAQVEAGKKRFSPEELQSQLAAHGQTEDDLKAIVRENLAIDRLVEAMIMPQIEVTEEAQRKAYEENKAQMQRPETVKASHILIRIEPGSSPEQKEAARRKAESLAQRARAGEVFAALVREASEDKRTREQGGELPWLSRGGREESFEEAAFALQPGEISGPVETGFGYHVIKLIERRPAGPISFDEAKGSIAQVLARRQLQAKLAQLVAKLRSEAEIQVFF